MKGFRELNVWRKAHLLTLDIYRVTAGFPREERFGLRGQLRRSSSSIPANLAEGCGRIGSAEFARFCSIAMGSASELEYHLLLAKDLNLIIESAHRELADRTVEVRRMLISLRQKLTTDN